ncbi:MAG: RNA-guided endonuclease TnpB family protein [Bacteroidota bacterium]
MLNKAYKYRLYPTRQQAQFLDKCMAINRKLWNATLAYYNEYFEQSKEDPANEGKGKSLPNKMIGPFMTSVVQAEGNEWMKEGISRTRDLLIKNNFIPAWKRYFDNLKNGKVKEAQARYRNRCQTTGKKFNLDRLRNIGKPKFRSWRDRQSFQIDDRCYNLDLENGVVCISKIKQYPLKFKINADDKLFKEDIIRTKTLTFSKTKTGKYYLSIAVEINEEIPDKSAIDVATTLGVDLGIKQLAIFSDETPAIENPKHLKKAMKKLKRLQRKASRQYCMVMAANEGAKWKDVKSNNWIKTQKKIAKLHEQVKNRRSATTHQLTHDLATSKYDTIAIEDLNVKGMSTTTKAKKQEEGKGFAHTGKKRKAGLNRNILDANFSEVRRQLEYKGEWNGKNILFIDRFAPSSKTCNNCGYINKELKLKHRHWTCPSCGKKLDRDINAAKNIRDMAVSQYNS